MKTEQEIREKLDEIEQLLIKIEAADECSYGDFNCDKCDTDLSQPTICTHKIVSMIRERLSEITND